MRSGELMHRLEVQVYSYTQDPNTGEIAGLWTTTDVVNAKVEGVQGREFLASSAEQSATTWRITMRYRDGFLTSSRLVGDRQVYNIKAALPDNRRRQLVLMCESGLLGAST